jgi:hypothetical protein
MAMQTGENPIMSRTPPGTPPKTSNLEKRLAEARTALSNAEARDKPLDQDIENNTKALIDLSVRMKNATDAEKPGLTKEAHDLVKESNDLSAERIAVDVVLRDALGIIKALEYQINNNGPSEQNQNQKQNFENSIRAPSQTTGPAVPDAGATEFNLANNGSIHQGRPLGKLPGIGSIENRFNNIGAAEPVAAAPVQAAVNPMQSGSLNAQGLPPLVRLDGQPLKPAENMYPAMAYRENEHQVWPQEAIDLASKKYPELPKQIEASRALVPDHPDDLLDPDYFPLPENPTLKDQLYHGIWKQKKQGGL